MSEEYNRIEVINERGRKDRIGVVIEEYMKY
jgi:hypothetical protein